MADDFEVPPTPTPANVSFGAAPGGRNGGRGGASKQSSKRGLKNLDALGNAKDGGTYEERLQRLRRQVKEKHDEFKREDERQRSREEQMANEWLAHRAETRENMAEDVKRRLAALTRQRQAQAHRAQLLQEAQKAKAQKALAASQAEESSESEQDHEAEETGICQAGLDQDDGLILQIGLAKARASIKPRKSLHGSPSKGARKKGEEGIGIAGSPGKAAATQKSIMQEAQEKFQGLCRSADGRQILQSGSKHQKQYREALMRGDPAIVELAEQEVNSAEDEVKEAEEDQGQNPAVSERLLLRRSRLRTMHQIAAQVLESKKRMSNSILPPLSARSLTMSCGLDDKAMKQAAMRMPSLS